MDEAIHIDIFVVLLMVTAIVVGGAVKARKSGEIAA
jgi:hypothetical protein